MMHAGMGAADLEEAFFEHGGQFRWTPPGKPAQTKTITAIAGQAVTVDFLD